MILRVCETYEWKGSMMADNPVPKADDGNPKFGRLLVVLLVAVCLIGVITVASEAFYS